MVENVFKRMRNGSGRGVNEIDTSFCNVHVWILLFCIYFVSIVIIVAILSGLFAITLLMLCCCGCYIIHLLRTKEKYKSKANFSSRFIDAAGDTSRRVSLAVKQWMKEGKPTPVTGEENKKAQLQMVANELPIETKITLSTDKFHQDGTPNEKYKFKLLEGKNDDINLEMNYSQHSSNPSAMSGMSASPVGRRPNIGVSGDYARNIHNIVIIRNI